MLTLDPLCLPLPLVLMIAVFLSPLSSLIMTSLLLSLPLWAHFPAFPPSFHTHVDAHTSAWSVDASLPASAFSAPFAAPVSASPAFVIRSQSRDRHHVWSLGRLIVSSSLISASSIFRRNMSATSALLQAFEGRHEVCLRHDIKTRMKGLLNDAS